MIIFALVLFLSKAFCNKR